MQATYQLRLLGSVQLKQAGKLVRGFESRKVIAVLGYLVVRRQGIARTHLADLFWRKLPEAKGRANLSRVLYNLGQHLPGCIQKDYHTVHFQPPADYWLDLEAFEDHLKEDSIAGLEKAVSLYRDEFMAGFYLDDCPEFETWLVTERERWLQATLRGLYKLVDYYRQ
ncbi:MAG: hypothetical protein KDJ52_15965, partial [Anaerolineae bacterium]|nr:hypothetical protein [Anaerolineae bacterium]